MNSYNCRVCKAEDITDWMVDNNFCGPETAICSPCKDELGRRLCESIFGNGGKAFKELCDELLSNRPTSQDDHPDRQCG